MGRSASHTLGEIIGTFFEEAMKDPIRKLSEKYSLYFDCQGEREARHTKKVTWCDINGSKHDLDYVIERNGSDSKIGEPVAFIELAWRRYTKHSKNKAQEIAGAVIPIAEKYAEFSPFMGVILCGVFTKPSLKQLEMQGFEVLYIEFEKMVEVFRENGAEIYYDENTKEKDFENIINQLATVDLDDVKRDLLRSCKIEIEDFVSKLESRILRSVSSIYILPLHGKSVSVNNVDSAISYIESYSELPSDAKIEMYIIIVYFNDGAEVKGEFKNIEMAIRFLQNIKNIAV